MRINHAPAWRPCLDQRTFNPLVSLQSTPPHEGRRQKHHRLQDRRGVSIHAPRTGGDVVKARPQLQSIVSIHAPARGATVYLQLSASTLLIGTLSRTCPNPNFQRYSVFKEQPITTNISNTYNAREAPGKTCPLPVRGKVHTIKGPSWSMDFLAPMCSTRRRQLDPRK